MIVTPYHFTIKRKGHGMSTQISERVTIHIRILTPTLKIYKFHAPSSHAKKSLNYEIYCLRFVFLSRLT